MRIGRSALATLASPLAALASPLAALVVLAATAAPAFAAGGGEPTTVGRFRLQSSFWVGLHQTLLEAAQRGGVENPGASPEERAAWDAAVATYRERFAESSYLFDEALLDTNDRLSAVEGLAAPPALPGGLESTLVAVAPVYRSRSWPAHDRANRFFIAVAATLLEEAGEELVAAHERAYGGAYPATVAVDVAPYGGTFGAYTTIHRGLVHTTMSSRDDSYQGFRALEMVLHEASHAIVGAGEGAIGPEIQAAARELGVLAPRQLWHAVLFYTSGELARRALAQRGVTAYQPYAYAGLYESAFRGLQEPLETHWQAYLDGKLSREEAIRRLVQSTGEPRKPS